MLQFLLLLFFVLPAGAQPLNSSTDLRALFILRSTLNVRSHDWPRKTDPCFTWSGVRCRSGRVVSINLSNLRRTRLGRLRPRFSVAAFGDLGRLEIFNSTGFVLPGPIPTRFGFELPISIRIVVLRSAEISGSIPSSISRLVNLEVLDLSRNLFAGPVPLTIGALPNLKTLVLAHNRLSGSPPDSLWELGLQVLDLSFNNFSGILPYSVEGGLNGNVRRLVFNVSNNLCYGPVSKGFQMLLRRFEFVDLSGNYFQGTVPLEEEDDRRTNQSFSLNCFKSALNQRNPVDCKHFYEAKGAPYDDTSSLIPVRAKEKSQLWKYILAGVSGFIGVVIVVVLVVVLCFKRARAGTALNQGGIDIRAVSFRAAPPQPPSRVVSKNRTTNGEVFTYEQLVRVTSEFSSMNLIKNGHSGDLYHGVLESGFSVVVKKIDLDKAGHEGYVAELEVFAKASHARLAPFLGQCLEGNERFLVYKRVPYGDLSSAMCKKTKQEEEELTSLDWITRLKIAAGVAEALCFLHHECNPPLVHRDVQASSILLDDKFEVRLGSLSEICAQVEDGHHNIFKVLQRPQTSARQGTSGSPTATCDYDIYCFGKVLLELVTGKLGISGNTDPASMEGLDPILGHIGACDKDSITKIIDPSLILDEDLTQEAWAVAVIAKSCMDPKPSNRPPARYVLKALENPLKIMRLYSRSNSVRLRTMSSRASWHGAFLGSWRKNSSDTGSGSDLLRRSGTVTSQGSVGDLSFTNRRRSVEIFPEPAGKDPADGDKVVGSV